MTNPMRDITDIKVKGVSLKTAGKVVLGLSILGSAVYGLSLVMSVVMLPINIVLGTAGFLLGWLPWKTALVGGFIYGAYKYFTKED